VYHIQENTLPPPIQPGWNYHLKPPWGEILKGRREKRRKCDRIRRKDKRKRKNLG
jgi:hypothetical protein